MALELTFSQVCDFIKKDEPKLIDAADKLLGLAIACSPIPLGPAAACLLPLIGVKNELVKISKGVFESVCEKRDGDFVARQARMQIAYGLICYTAFFEALDRQLPDEVRQRIGLLESEKASIASDAHKHTKTRSNRRPDPNREDTVKTAATTLPIPFPHPTESLSQQQERLAKLYQFMAEGFKALVQRLAFWEAADEEEQALVLKAVEQMPSAAVECFEAQYFELCRRYEDFAVWANIQEHKNTKELIASLSAYVQQYSALAKPDRPAIDIGFAKLHKAVANIPQILDLARAQEIVEGLKLHYHARLNDPIIADKDQPQEDRPPLSFPPIRDAFIPQAFRVLRYTTSTSRLEDETTWRELERREDLGAFLLSYLSSPYSTETPLVVLGHPGSGKSLLTTVLSAQLMSENYTAVRVPLREVDSEAGIVSQIEEQIGRVTSIRVDSWARLRGAFRNNPPIVIFDGYDELLQASGKVFAGYLKDVQAFQKSEAEQGRPVRVIVTSRITLIDKATIPQGSTIIRLLEFNKRQRDRWISIWNKANAHYFGTSIQPFVLPEGDDKDAAKILTLAEQPLLLLMLALYDSEDNRLRRSKSLERTALYESLIIRFVTRERNKERSFEDASKNDRAKEIDRDLQRLGVAAIGMYNRRKLHILSTELNDDLKFFSLERELVVASGRALSQADLLLGRFFFVHKSKSQLKAGAADLHEEASAFEFMHNTFGEFLTADFIVRQAIAEVETIIALKQNEALSAQLEQKLGSADGFSRAWFASLIYNPLFTRPVVLEMMREWTNQMLRRKQLSKADFLSHLNTIILNQIRRLLGKREMPSIMRGETAQEGYRAPFGDHPLLGHLAIYSLNLIILRVIVTDEPFIFDESAIASHEDGTRPWDQLTHIWRSWFSIDNLNGVTGFLRADRDRSQVTVHCPIAFRVAESRNRLETYLNIGVSLADNIPSSLAAFYLGESVQENILTVDDIGQRLSSEGINPGLPLAVRRLMEVEPNVNDDNMRELLSHLYQTVETSFIANQQQQCFDQIDAVLDVVINRISRIPRQFRRLRVTRKTEREWYPFFDPPFLEELAFRSPTVFIKLLRLTELLGPRIPRRYAYLPTSFGKLHTQTIVWIACHVDSRK